MTAKFHVLSNGLTVAVEPMAGVETIAVGLYADVGARSEPAGLSGLAHMFEHMVFKGAGSRDARAIAEAIEDKGGSINAWTARDHTVFHTRMLADDLTLGLDLVADLVRSPHLNADELEREKEVVLAELGEANDTPDDIIFDHLSAAAFADQPLGLPVLGNEASIAAIDAAAIKRWLDEQYRPERLVIAAAGKVDEDALLKVAEQRFGDLDAVGVPEITPASFTSGTRHDRRRFDQLHLSFAFPAPSYRDIDLHAMALYTSAVGGGMSSRLFQELREDRGLAYSVYSWAQPYADAGMFGVYCAAQQEKGAEAFTLAREVLARAAETLDQAELDRAKAQAKAGLLMGLEAVATRCDHLARQIQVHGRIVTPAESVALIDAVTVEDARRAGQAALSGPMAVASVGGRLARVA
ncbi:MAG: M16 family metallopeptidase [Sphingomonadaceae bacterium]